MARYIPTVSNKLKVVRRVSLASNSRLADILFHPSVTTCRFLTTCPRIPVFWLPHLIFGIFTRLKKSPKRKTATKAATKTPY